MKRHLINALIMHLYERVKKLHFCERSELSSQCMFETYIDDNALSLKFVFSATSIYHYLTKYWILSYYLCTSGELRISAEWLCTHSKMSSKLLDHCRSGSACPDAVVGSKFAMVHRI